MMKLKAKSLLAMAATACLAIYSCNDTSEIGNSIVQDKIAVTVDSTFTVTGQSKLIERIQSRTTSHLLGRISAKGYGSLQSDVVTQFMPSSELSTVGTDVNDIDSLVLYMLVRSGEFVGDSLAHCHRPVKTDRAHTVAHHEPPARPHLGQGLRLAAERRGHPVHAVV